MRVWHEVRERALEVRRVALELAPDAWGEFFAEAAGGGLRDDLSRDLDRERQVAEQTGRIREQGGRRTMPWTIPYLSIPYSILRRRSLR